MNFPRFLRGAGSESETVKSAGSVSVRDGSRSGTNKRGSGLFTGEGGARLSPWDEQYSAEGFSLKDLIDKGEICEVRCHIRSGLNGPCVFGSEMVKEC
ncbi:hypothetical protein F2Q70_00038733 [Brassica cretica]|uniref:Uncharacterized protein n=1 Tax=Brassica cretica TaxID=69181 RepID=A0A8S9K5Q3_BRACR|nr:hypothetical protein F2Q70_00038733 [Brassica cretica]